MKMSVDPITYNDERISSLVGDRQSIIEATIQSLIVQSNESTSITWDTTNGINTNIFDTGSTITLICQNNIRHIIGNLVTKAKDSSNNDITFTAGSAVSVLPVAKFSTSVLRFTDALPNTWLVELDGAGIRLASTALVTITGAHTISFSYTYIVAENETEVHTTS